MYTSTKERRYANEIGGRREEKGISFIPWPPCHTHEKENTDFAAQQYNAGCTMSQLPRGIPWAAQGEANSQSGNYKYCQYELCVSLAYAGRGAGRPSTLMSTRPEGPGQFRRRGGLLRVFKFGQHPVRPGNQCIPQAACYYTFFLSDKHYRGDVALIGPGNTVARAAACWHIGVRSNSRSASELTRVRLYRPARFVVFARYNNMGPHREPPMC
ncbi:hypothetical protein MGYG_06126 [Nannizzia gypsea CBS 118893]|uniref:Uncharacterized protein n=1 Tax=Arthroderma gypseum (strain ATCC MYA-4604 / CBS 118893) TaxID=535722 RepID=E4V0J5_ARTGP|nr:hypothetical protein MGYG_06126 [Nannizzia gypsea CBS 118893]EFR03132.1 hypothetical protein MGYG_06126 [Nannizzia gypsea CBS 118893]